MTRFETNLDLLSDAGARLTRWDRIHWVTGGAASGKSTVCRAIAQKYNVALYDMDEHIYGAFMPQYTWERHPASKTWFSAADSLGWILSLSADEFDGLNRAANVEYLDLFAADLATLQPSARLLVDGGFTHPTVLAAVVPAHRIVCLEVTDEESARAWAHDPARAAMKDAIQQLPDAAVAWDRFLSFDKQTNETLRSESDACGVVRIRRHEAMTVDALADQIVSRFGL